MPRLHLTAVLAAVLPCGLCAGCSEPDVLHHPGLGAGLEVDTEGQVAATGNYPDDAVTACGELPAGVEPIEGLASAWVTDASGGNLRLVLSDRALDCGDDIFSISSGCATGWAQALTLTAVAFTPGKHELAAYPDVCTEVAMVEGGPDGCAGGEVGGGGVGGEVGGGDVGGGGLGGVPGELEIYRMDDTCVVGRLDLEGFSALPGPGGFVAQRCAGDGGSGGVDAGCF
jgi:hypothetical protein